MKAINLSLISVLSILLLLSCNDDDELKPVTLKNRENTTISFIYPNDTKYSFPIQGGDGNYSIKSDNEDIVKANMISTIDFSIEIVGLGETKITITDNSRNSLVLNIIVDYETHNYIVRRQDVRVTGGDLTGNEKKAIVEKQLAGIPVKIGGGFKFIHTDPYNYKGRVVIYTDTYGSKGMETSFEMKEHKNDNFGESLKWGYEVVINNEKRIFVPGRYYPTTKAIAKIPMALMEDVTREVQKEYPKAESVITSQLIEGVSY